MKFCQTTISVNKCYHLLSMSGRCNQWDMTNIKRCTYYIFKQQYLCGKKYKQI